MNILESYIPVEVKKDYRKLLAYAMRDKDMVIRNIRREYADEICDLYKNKTFCKKLLRAYAKKPDDFFEYFIFVCIMYESLSNYNYNIASENSYGNSFNIDYMKGTFPEINMALEQCLSDRYEYIVSEETMALISGHFMLPIKVSANNFVVTQYIVEEYHDLIEDFVYEDIYSIIEEYTKPLKEFFDMLVRNKDKVIDILRDSNIYKNYDVFG